MKKRHVLAPLAAVVTAAAALALFLVPATQHSAADDEVDDTQVTSGRLDGWANRDIDIGGFGFAARTGSILDGWGNRDMDISTLGAAAEPESILDGWGNRDMDISTLGCRRARPRNPLAPRRVGQPGHGHRRRLIRTAALDGLPPSGPGHTPGDAFAPLMLGSGGHARTPRAPRRQGVAEQPDGWLQRQDDRGVLRCSGS